jgi:hypothetical protein
MQSGKYTSPLYLLPLPPSPEQFDNKQQELLLTIYKRMESLLLRNYNHPNTRQKFDLLNNLYQKMVLNSPKTKENKAAKINFLELIVNHSCSQKAQSIINQHRGLYWPFFHSTKTSVMFNNFKKQLSDSKPNHNNF